MTETAMNTLSDERLAEMRAGLEGVTPGPWKYEGSIYEHMGAGLRSLPDDRGFAQLWKSGTVAIDAAHIARCDPDTIRSLIAELQSLRQSDTRIEGGGEKCPECGKPLAECEAGYADAFAAAAPEHVEGDVLSVGMEATRWSAIGVGQMAADPEGRWVSIRDFDQAQSIIQRAERERGLPLPDTIEDKVEAIKNLSLISTFNDGMNDHRMPPTIENATDLLKWANGHIFRLSWSHAKETAARRTAEAQLADAVKVICDIKALTPKPTLAITHAIRDTVDAFLSTIGEKPDADEGAAS